MTWFVDLKNKIISKIVNTKKFQRWHFEYTDNSFNKFIKLMTLENGRNAYFSMCGEDITIISILENYCNKTIYNHTYIDIGANNPVENSNTYMFYLKGGNGVLIEPNPQLINSLKEERPKDTIICAGISFDENVKSAPFYSFESPYEGWSGFDEKRVELANKKGIKLSETIEQKLIPINKLFEKYFPDEPPVIVSIDVEGLEIEILNTINFNKYRPIVFCIESDQKDFTEYAKHPIVDLMTKNGYLYMANNSIDMFFLEKSYFTTEKFIWGNK